MAGRAASIATRSIASASRRTGVDDASPSHDCRVAVWNFYGRYLVERHRGPGASQVKPDALCPRGHGYMQPSYGLGHYAPHFSCSVCRKVYVREYGQLVECVKPGEHMKDPPPWVIVRPANST